MEGKTFSIKCLLDKTYFFDCFILSTLLLNLVTFIDQDHFVALAPIKLCHRILFACQYVAAHQ